MDRKVYLYTNEIINMLQGAYEPPVTCEIDLTNACQLKCEFCMYEKYRWEDRAELEYDLAISLLNELREIGVKSVTFTGGGEPLLHPRAADIMDAAFKGGLDVGLITNGIALDKLPAYLVNSLKFIRVSIDAASPETYKKVKRKNLFETVKNNILQTVATGKNKVTIGLSFVVCKDNEHETYIAEKMAQELAVDYIQFKPAWMNGDIFEGDLGEQSDTVYVAERYRANDNLPCTIAGLIGIVGANGKIYFCCQHRGKIQYLLGDLHQASFESIWKRRSHVAPALKECPQCRYMSYAKKFREIPSVLIKHRTFL